MKKAARSGAGKQPPVQTRKHLTKHKTTKPRKQRTARQESNVPEAHDPLLELSATTATTMVALMGEVMQDLVLADHLRAPTRAHLISIYLLTLSIRASGDPVTILRLMKDLKMSRVKVQFYVDRLVEMDYLHLVDPQRIRGVMYDVTHKSHLEGFTAAPRVLGLVAERHPEESERAAEED